MRSVRRWSYKIIWGFGGGGSCIHSSGNQAKLYEEYETGTKVVGSVKQTGTALSSGRNNNNDSMKTVKIDTVLGK